jgi:hypothetical protein
MLLLPWGLLLLPVCCTEVLLQLLLQGQHNLGCSIPLLTAAACCRPTVLARAVLHARRLLLLVLLLLLLLWEDADALSAHIAS